jgi:SagB-type dehydrogenase family enzyme
MEKGIGREFIEKTKYQYLEKSDQMKGLSQPPLELPPSNKSMHNLPDPHEINLKKITINEVIENRKSVRSYSNKPITKQELSYLLWSTQGVKKVIQRPVTLRTVPSAGARHCFETYVLVNNVEGLKPGLYRFLAIDHKLQEVNISSGLSEKITKACFNQRFIMQSAVTFIWTAVAYRMMWRYGERGYRYMHLDAGHVCQNLYLSAMSIDAGVCAIAAFNDDELNKLIGINGEEQFTIYVATLGKV